MAFYQDSGFWDWGPEKGDSRIEKSSLAACKSGCISGVNMGLYRGYVVVM